MKTLLLLTTLAIALPVGLTGCDRYTETHSKTTTDEHGNVTREQKKTTIDEQGNKTTETHRETTNER